MTSKNSAVFSFLNSGVFVVHNKLNSDKQKSDFAPFIDLQIPGVLWQPQRPAPPLNTALKK